MDRWLPFHGDCCWIWFANQSDQYTTKVKADNAVKHPGLFEHIPTWMMPCLHYDKSYHAMLLINLGRRFDIHVFQLPKKHSESIRDVTRLVCLRNCWCNENILQLYYVNSILEYLFIAISYKLAVFRLWVFARMNSGGEEKECIWLLPYDIYECVNSFTRFTKLLTKSAWQVNTYSTYSNSWHWPVCLCICEVHKRKQNKHPWRVPHRTY